MGLDWLPVPTLFGRHKQAGWDHNEPSHDYDGQTVMNRGRCIRSLLVMLLFDEKNDYFSTQKLLKMVVPPILGFLIGLSLLGAQPTRELFFPSADKFCPKVGHHGHPSSDKSSICLLKLSIVNSHFRMRLIFTAFNNRCKLIILVAKDRTVTLGPGLNNSDCLLAQRVLLGDLFKQLMRSVLTIVCKQTLRVFVEFSNTSYVFSAFSNKCCNKFLLHFSADLFSTWGSHKNYQKNTRRKKILVSFCFFYYYYLDFFSFILFVHTTQETQEWSQQNLPCKRRSIFST